MSNILYGLHDVSENHLDTVIAQMQTIGSPTIRAINCGDYYKAVEGTHRLAAAAILGLAVNIVLIEQDDVISASNLDLQDLEDRDYTGAELFDEVYSSNCPIYKIADDNTIVEI